MNEALNFTLTVKGESIQVSQHTVGKNQVFRVVFPDKRAPLIVSKAKGANIGAFWTSIPEGRQQEAEDIGEFIEEYLRNRY